MKSKTRQEAAFENKCGKFVISKRNFDLQYYNFYNARYLKMFDIIKQSALDKFGQDVKIIKLNQLMEHPGEDVCVTGVLLKVMKQQRSVLREVSEDLELIPEEEKEKYIDSKDILSLQDDTEACLLQGGLDIAGHVTGVMIAVLGREDDNGNRFIVSDYCYPSIAPQLNTISPPTTEQLVLLISDLGFSVKQDMNVVSARDYLIDFITGNLDGLTNRGTQIVRVIIAGNSLCHEARDEERELEALENANEDEWNRKEKAYTVDSLKKVDDFLYQLAKVVPVDLMPGECDPATIMLPQQPFHSKMLPKSSPLPGLFRATNPYVATISGRTVIGNCSRVIKSIQEASTFDEPVDILEATLKWRHLAPTAPDTVFSCPFKGDDPFVIENQPHLYFAGSQSSFNTKIVTMNNHKTRIVAVPSFKKTRTAIMVNMRNLGCEVVAFN